MYDQLLLIFYACGTIIFFIIYMPSYINMFHTGPCRPDFGGESYNVKTLPNQIHVSVKSTTQSPLQAHLITEIDPDSTTMGNKIQY